MKIGVLSDSHDHLDHLSLAVQCLRREQVELVLHAGDFISPFTIPVLHQVGVPIKAVFGNNDGEKVGLSARFQSLGHEVQERPFAYEWKGKKLLLLHEPVALDTLVGSKEYDLVVYGHTHEIDVRQPEQGALLVNPGEVCAWVKGLCSCAVVDLASRRVDIHRLHSR